MKKLKIGMSWWGLNSELRFHQNIHIDTPDGHRYGRPIMINALQARGHEVFALQDAREPEHTENKGVRYVGDRVLDESLPLDVIFLEWRWSTYKNDRTHAQHDPKRYESDLDRQREVIEYYRGKCPIIAWDTDLKITPEDEAAYPELILTDPSFKTNRLTRDRTSLPFWTDFRELFPVSEPYSVYGYVGNNYERPDEFDKFYYKAAPFLRIHGIQTSMYGNWLQVSPERDHPSKLIGEQPYVAFNDRRNFYESMSIMNRFLATTHVSKPRYYETGFISPRFVEALACNCPALVPAAQTYSTILGSDWVVNSRDDVIERLKEISKLSLNQRLSLLKSQRKSLRQLGTFSVDNVVRFIESQAG